jgi:hypothetical protein
MAAIRRAVARAAAREAAAEGAACSLCMERPQGVVFGCGHQVLTQPARCTSHHTVGCTTIGRVQHAGGAQCRLCCLQVCADCSRERCPKECPFCREPIITRINLFRS